MSSVCLCTIENHISKSEIRYFVTELKKIAQYYNRGIKFEIDWKEPLVSQLPINSFVMDIKDSLLDENCEYLLLPDGWFFNGKTNELTFRSRMMVLEEISDLFTQKNYVVHFYFFDSGEDIDDFSTIKIRQSSFVNYLSDTIGIKGVESGVHICILPNKNATGDGNH